MVRTRSHATLAYRIAGCVTCLVLALVLVIGGIIGYLVLQEDAEPTGGRTTTATDDVQGGGDQGGGDSAGTGEIVLPPGVAEDQPYLEISSRTDGPVLDVHLDFLCPHCKTFEETQGEDLAQMAEAGEITLRVHPRPMLDASSTPTGYSGRAANAAVCAYTEDPAQWLPAQEALFANQPGTSGLPDEELVGIVDEATGLDISECQAAGTYQPWLQEVVEPDAQETTSGTPTVLIDGEEFSGDLASPGTVREAVEAG